MPNGFKYIGLRLQIYQAFVLLTVLFVLIYTAFTVVVLRLEAKQQTSLHLIHVINGIEAELLTTILERHHSHADPVIGKTMLQQIPLTQKKLLDIKKNLLPQEKKQVVAIEAVLENFKSGWNQELVAQERMQEIKDELNRHQNALIKKITRLHRFYDFSRLHGYQRNPLDELLIQGSRLMLLVNKELYIEKQLELFQSNYQLVLQKINDSKGLILHAAEQTSDKGLKELAGFLNDFVSLSEQLLQDALASARKSDANRQVMEENEHYLYTNLKQLAAHIKDIAQKELEQVKRRQYGGGAVVILLSFLSALIFGFAIRRVEQALRESQARYHDLYENAPNVYFSVDTKGFIRHCNRRATELFGYSGKELLGRNIMTLYADTADGKEKARDILRHFLAGQVIRNREMQMQHKDGSLLWIHLTVNALRDKEGDIVAGRAILVDITKRKLEQAKNLQLGRILEGSLHEIYMFDAGTLLFTQVNRGARQNLGYSSDELKMMTPLDLKPEISREQFKELIAPLYSGKKEKIIFSTVHRRKDGSMYPVQVYLQLSRLDERPVFVATVQDLSEQVKMKDAIKNIVVGVASGWEENFFQSMVLQLAKTLGADCAFIGEFQAEASMVKTCAVCLDGKVVDNFEYNPALSPCKHTIREHIFCSSGIETEFPGNVFPIPLPVVGYAGVSLFDKDARILGVMAALYRDHIPSPFFAESILRIFAVQTAAEITRAHSSLAIQQSKEDAEKSSRAKSAFLANMSHELYSPLNAILGCVDIVEQDSALSGKYQDSLQVIRRSGEHLLDLINDVLEFSKNEAGILEIVPDVLELPDFIRKLEGMIKIRARQKQLDFVCRLSEKLPVFIEADAKRLRQILLNLTGNAIKFTERGLVEMNITPVSNSPCIIRFTVKDSGIGIGVDDLKSIFQAFGQGGDSKQRAQGSGLGLAISKELVEKMGGKLEVDSVPGKGSCFSFNLPCKIPAGYSGHDGATYLEEHKPVEKKRQDKPLIPPGESELKALCSAAKHGRMKQVHEWVRKTRKTNADYHAFADRVEELANAFDARAIIDLIQKH